MSLMAFEWHEDKTKPVDIHHAQHVCANEDKVVEFVERNSVPPFGSILIHLWTGTQTPQHIDLSHVPGPINWYLHQERALIRSTFNCFGACSNCNFTRPVRSALDAVTHDFVRDKYWKDRVKQFQIIYILWKNKDNPSSDLWLKVIAAV